MHGIFIFWTLIHNNIMDKYTLRNDVKCSILRQNTFFGLIKALFDIEMWIRYQNVQKRKPVSMKLYTCGYETIKWGKYEKLIFFLQVPVQVTTKHIFWSS